MSRLKRAVRTRSKLRIGLFGPSGSGKTTSALKLAHGLCKDWSKIAVIDTEKGSASLYACGFNTLELPAPYRPEAYVTAIKECEAAGMEVIIIDSISHEWEGPGGCLEIHTQETERTKNSYTAWQAVTPRHNRFIDGILSSTAHVICCARTKSDVVMKEREGKNGRTIQVPEKVGLKAVTRDGFDYEMTLAFDLDQQHFAKPSKDRTGLFMTPGTPDDIITEAYGERLLAWLNEAEEAPITDAEHAHTLALAIGNAMTARGLKPEHVKALTGLETLQGQPIAALESALNTVMSMNGVHVNV